MAGFAVSKTNKKAKGSFSLGEKDRMRAMETRRLDLFGNDNAGTGKEVGRVLVNSTSPWPSPGGRGNGGLVIFCTIPSQGPFSLGEKDRMRAMESNLGTACLVTTTPGSGKAAGKVLVHFPPLMEPTPDTASLVTTTPGTGKAAGNMLVHFPALSQRERGWQGLPFRHDPKEGSFFPSH